MFEDWLRMEQFYYQQLPTIAIVMVILCFILCILIPYRRIAKIRRILLGLCLLIFVGFSYLAMNYYHYQADIQQISWIDAGIRSIDKQFYFDYPYSFNEQNAYKQYNNRKNFQHLSMYQAETISEPIKVMGLTDRYLFFELQAEKYKVPQYLVTYQTKLQQPIRQGIQYQLKDERFIKLGFYPKSNKFLESYVLPADYEFPPAETLNEDDYHYPFKVLASWYNP